MGEPGEQREREREMCVYLCYKTTPLIYYDTVFLLKIKATCKASIMLLSKVVYQN